MSMSVKFMVGFLSLVIMLLLVMSWFDGQATYISSSDMEDISNLNDFNIVGGTQTTGESSTNLQWKSGIWGTITKWIDFDFSFWYSSIQTGYSQTTCEAAGGRWDGNSSLCGFPNQWDIVHIMIFRPIGWGIVICFIAVGIGKLFGVF